MDSPTPDEPGCTEEDHRGHRQRVEHSNKTGLHTPRPNLIWALIHDGFGRRALDRVAVAGGDPLPAMRELVADYGLAAHRNQLMAGRYPMLTGRRPGQEATALSVFHLPMLPVQVTVEMRPEGGGLQKYLTVRVTEQVGRQAGRPLRSGLVFDLKVEVLDATWGQVGMWDATDRDRWMEWAGIRLDAVTPGTGLIGVVAEPSLV